MGLEVLGPLQVRPDGAPVTIPGAKPRAILTMLGRLRRRVANDRNSHVDGDLINRSEMFDETQINAALARFDALDSTFRR